MGELVEEEDGTVALADVPPRGAAMLSRLTALGIEFFRFGIVGTCGFVVDATVLQFCLSVLALGPYAGRAVSFAVGATFTWLGNRYFTFRGRGRSAWLGQWSRFVMLMGLGFALNYGTYAALVASVKLFADHPVLGVAAGAVAGMFVNFATARNLVFRHHASESHGTSQARHRAK